MQQSADDQMIGSLNNQKEPVQNVQVSEGAATVISQESAS